MDYNSFYGGRRGASFVIVKRYKRIDAPDPSDEVWNNIIRHDLGLSPTATITAAQREAWVIDSCMVPAFKQGGAYKTVNYDEYVIIDTINKNDIDNGKVYRRGYEYNNDIGGAVFIGQIVGPAGMAPHVEMKTLKEVKDLGDDGLVDEEGNSYRVTEGDYAPLENLVPGKYVEDGVTKYHDAIQWRLCSIRDINSHETTVHVGFVFPYEVIDYTAESVSPYYHRSNNTADFVNQDLIVRTDDQKHPYYEKWHMSVPKGIHGDAFKNFRITTVPAEQDKDIELQDYTGEDDDRIVTPTKPRQILVYDYYNYDKDPSGEPVALYLGDYNMIENFQIDDDGTVTIDYSHDDQDVYPNLFKWIKTITLNPNNGQFTIIYNYDKDPETGEPTKFTTSLQWVKDMDVSTDGTVTWKYTNRNDKVYENFIKWITDVSLNVEDGHLQVNYNYDKEQDGSDTQYNASLQWVKDCTIDDEGTITFIYTNKEDSVYEKFLKSIKTVTLNAETGEFEITYNHATDAKGNPTKYTTSLTWVKDIDFANDGTVTLTYTDQDDTTYQNLVKWVTSTTLDPETGKFTVIYNYDNENDGTPTKYEQDLRWVKEVSITDNGTITFDYTNGEDTVYEQYLKTITDTSLNPETGKFIVTYNTLDEEGSPTTYEQDLRWVKEVSITDNGTITFDYTNGEDTVYEQFFKTITSATLNPETGRFEIVYNNTDENGDPIKYTSDLRWVKQVSLADDGTITFDYTNGEDTVFQNYVRSIKQVSLNKETGNFKVEYNFPTEQDGSDSTYEVNLDWLKDIEIDAAGTITMKYTESADKKYDNFLKTITGVTLNTENGHFEVLYNYPDEVTGQNKKYSTDLRWVKGIRLKDDGHIVMEYTTGPETETTNAIKWITSAEIADDGTFTLKYNDNTENSFDKIKWIDDITLDADGLFTVKFNNGDPDYTATIKTINGSHINTGNTEGEGNQKLVLEFSDGTEQEVGNPINYIIRTAIETNTYHLLVLYADPVKRAAGPNMTWDGRDDWVDLGYIGNGQVGAMAAKESDTEKMAIVNSLPVYSTWWVIEESE